MASHLKCKSQFLKLLARACGCVSRPVCLTSCCPPVTTSHWILAAPGTHQVLFSPGTSVLIPFLCLESSSFKSPLWLTPSVPSGFCSDVTLLLRSSYKDHCIWDRDLSPHITLPFLFTLHYFLPLRLSP